MVKRFCWVVERKPIRGRIWSFEKVHTWSVSSMKRREWEGVDGASYRYKKYIPEELVLDAERRVMAKIRRRADVLRKGPSKYTETAAVWEAFADAESMLGAPPKGKT